MSPPDAAPPATLPGLDTLRALAALFVVLGHIPMNQAGAGLPAPAWGAFFFRGQPAVLFFFTLSGFLITYLLLLERRRTGTISVRRFYLRRVLRIWPLYFAVVALGLVVYKVLLPWLGIPHPADYAVGTAVLLYVCFLPNLMNALTPVGGILNPLWSIGIEEQFYLGWAPAVRRGARHLPWICLAVFAVFFGVFVASTANVFGTARAKLFTGQLKFHFMAAGAFAAWLLHTRPERLLAGWVFRSRAAQGLLLAAVAAYYFVGFVPGVAILEEALQVFLYAWLVLNTAANPRRIVGFTSRPLARLGVISYGIYMLHMPAVYATSALFRATTFWHGHLVAYLVAYYALAFGSTLLLAALSYRFFERPFLRLKDARFAPPAAAAAARRPAPG